MTQTEQQTAAQAQILIDAMDDVLDRERAALVAGDLEGVTRLLTEKETLIDQLNGLGDTPATTIEPLHDKLTRNQALLSSALQGIRIVANRLSALRRIRRSLDTYDKSGKKSPLGDIPQNKIEKRA